MVLDLFKLHKKEDKDTKSLILAKGKNLKREVEILTKELSQKYQKYQLANKIAKN